MSEAFRKGKELKSIQQYLGSRVRDIEDALSNPEEPEE